MELFDTQDPFKTEFYNEKAMFLSDFVTSTIWSTIKANFPGNAIGDVLPADVIHSLLADVHRNRKNNDARYTTNEYGRVSKSTDKKRQGRPPRNKQRPSTEVHVSPDPPINSSDDDSSSDED